MGLVPFEVIDIYKLPSNVLSSILSVCEYSKYSNFVLFSNDFCLSLSNVMFSNNQQNIPHWLFSFTMLDNMLFFHYFPSAWCCIVRYLHSSEGCPSSWAPTIICILLLELFWAGGIEEHCLLTCPPLGSWIGTKLSSTYSSRSSIFSP